MAAEKRLLIVDDEPGIRQIIDRTATGLGYEVTATDNADAFKRAYETFAPTLIVLDIVMPRTDGIELIKWLIERGATASIIVASGYNALYAKMAATLGSDRGLSVSFLDKPFKIDALRDAIRESENGARPRDALTD